MDKITKIWSQPVECNVFCGTEASNIISVLPSTESLKIAIITLMIPYLSLSITMDRKNIVIKVRRVESFYAVNFVVRYIYKSLQTVFLCLKNIIECTSLRSSCFSMTTDTKVHYTTLATLNQSELKFTSLANARKLLDQYPIYDKSY